MRREWWKREEFAQEYPCTAVTTREFEYVHPIEADDLAAMLELERKFEVLRRRRDSYRKYT